MWIFLQEAIAASLARRLGSAVLTRAMDSRHQVGLDSYDRFFPNQDTMPKGGFGNLIALPFQRGPMSQGNSVFLDRQLEPYADQWGYLASVQRIPTGHVESLVADAARNGAVLGVRSVLFDTDGEDDPWTLPPSGRRPVSKVPCRVPRFLQSLRHRDFLRFQRVPPAEAGEPAWMTTCHHTASRGGADRGSSVEAVETESR